MMVKHRKIAHTTDYARTDVGRGDLADYAGMERSASFVVKVGMERKRMVTKGRKRDRKEGKMSQLDFLLYLCSLRLFIYFFFNLCFFLFFLVLFLFLFDEGCYG